MHSGDVLLIQGKWQDIARLGKEDTDWVVLGQPLEEASNALVMRAGQYTFMDYIKVGLPLQIIMGIVMVFVLPLLFPL